MFKVGKSGIAGRGVFAARNFKAGQLITTLRGRLHRKHYRQHSELRVGYTWIPIDYKLWIEPVSPLRFINHSCDANSGFKEPTKIYAKRHILRGEEITVDYSSIEHTSFWCMNCACGSGACRSIVGSIHYLSDALYNSHLPFVPLFIRKSRNTPVRRSRQQPYARLRHRVGIHVDGE